MTARAWRYVLFDLDNTLYSDQTGLLRHIDQRINQYLFHQLGLDARAINQMREEYWRKYGTTLRGVKENHGLDPLDYIAYAYDIEIEAFLSADRRLAGMLQRLPWPKGISSITNSLTQSVERMKSDA